MTKRVGADPWYELHREIDRLRAALADATREIAAYARRAGEAEGRLRASEWPGVVDGWRERAEKAERERDEARADHVLVLVDAHEMHVEMGALVALLMRAEAHIYRCRHHHEHRAAALDQWLAEIEPLARAFRASAAQATSEGAGDPP